MIQIINTTTLAGTHIHSKLTARDCLYSGKNLLSKS